MDNPCDNRNADMVVSNKKSGPNSKLKAKKLKRLKKSHQTTKLKKLLKMKKKMKIRNNKC